MNFLFLTTTLSCVISTLGNLVLKGNVLFLVKTVDVNLFIKDIQQSSLVMETPANPTHLIDLYITLNF